MRALRRSSNMMRNIAGSPSMCSIISCASADISMSATRGHQTQRKSRANGWLCCYLNVPSLTNNSFHRCLFRHRRFNRSTLPNRPVQMWSVVVSNAQANCSYHQRNLLTPQKHINKGNCDCYQAKCFHSSATNFFREVLWVHIAEQIASWPSPASVGIDRVRRYPDEFFPASCAAPQGETAALLMPSKAM